MNNDNLRIPVWVLIVLFLISFLLLNIILGATIVPMLLSGTSESTSHSVFYLYVEEIIMLVSVFVPAILILHFSHQPISVLGLNIKGRGKDMLYGMFTAGVIYLVGFSVALFSGTVQVTAVHFDFLSLLVYFIFFLIVAVTEEVMVRGFILGQLLRTSLNKFVALFLSSLIFASFHLFNPNLSWLPMVNLVLAGILLGSTYIYTRNLWFPIILHLFWNWIQGPVLGYEVSGLGFGTKMFTLHLSSNKIVNGGAFGFEGSIICFVLVIVMTGLIILWSEKHQSIVSR
ncbi:MAG: type II CAAX endopeptidase family protein [Bacteroidaceae bacterium]|nr:CPBP family intramembrane metalloprotease [Bacteroidaceae bacterium]